jgi:uncharacterized repeat protein (TIGR03847 family)
VSQSFSFEAVDHFMAGTVGGPGQRVFYIQAGAAGTVVSVKCEKQQVGALAEYLAGVLEDLPPAEPEPSADDLVEPVLAEWPAGLLSVAYDDTADRILLVVEEAVPESDDPDAVIDEPATLRLRLTRGQVVAYIEQAARLLQAGRPPCPLCGHPRGPDHSCPKTNGHKPPA